MIEQYNDMISISNKLLKSEAPGHSLQTHDLVHEAYLRIHSMGKVNWKDRKHFNNVCSKIMFRILVDHARYNNSEKHGGHYQHINLSELNYELPDIKKNNDLFDALEYLEQENFNLAHIVKLRYFSGLNINEIAELLDVSAATVKRKWVLARCWLLKELISQR